MNKPVIPVSLYSINPIQLYEHISKQPVKDLGFRILTSGQLGRPMVVFSKKN